MNPQAIRDQNLKRVYDLGLDTNPALPLLDLPQAERPTEEIIRRAMALHATVASSYGFDRSKAMAWIAQEDLWDSLTPKERMLLDGGAGNIADFQDQVEALWALMWSLQLVGVLDFGQECDNQFVRILPNLKVAESYEPLLRRARHRPMFELFEMTDLAYCLHWSVRHSMLSGTRVPGRVPPYVIVERRRALEWLVGDDEWDEVVMDT
jgi:hypothetical protein